MFGGVFRVSPADFASFLRVGRVLNMAIRALFGWSYIQGVRRVTLRNVKFLVLLEVLPLKLACEPTAQTVGVIPASMRPSPALWASPWCSAAPPSSWRHGSQQERGASVPPFAEILAGLFRGLEFLFFFGVRFFDDFLA